MKKTIVLVAIISFAIAALAQASYAAGEKPKYGGTLRFVYSLDPSSLDPHQSVSGGDAYFYNPIFDNLALPKPDCELSNDISSTERWEFPDPKIVVLHLRKGIKFHDGTDFNGEAVKFNIERLQNPTFKGGFVAPHVKGIERVEVVDPHTVKLHLKKPDASLLPMFEAGAGVVSSPTAVKKMGDDKYSFSPVGSGPFKLKKFVPGSYATLVKNKKYWRKDQYGNKTPYLDRIKISIVKEEAVISAALETGQADLTYVPLMDVDRFDANPKIKVYKVEGGGVGDILIFNRAKPPMDNVNLRRAVAYAVDPEAIKKGAFFGKATVAKGGMWPIGTWAHDSTVSRPYYDVEKAKEFLKLGGKPNGFSMDLIIWNGATHIRAAEIVKEHLSKVGINASIKTYDVGTATKKFFKDNETPVYLTSWPRRPEPNIIAGYSYRSDGYFNAGKLKDPHMDELIAKGAATYDLEKRKAIYRQIDEIVLMDCRYVPLIYSNTFAGAWNYVKGMENFFGCDIKPRTWNLWLDK
jgi:ABC-type transport system substrate-binding protein